MKIHFETIIEDVIAFNRFHLLNSPTWRRQRFMTALIGPGVFALGSLLFLVNLIEEHGADQVLSGILIVVFVVNIALSVPLFFIVRWWTLRSVTKFTRHFLAEGGNRTLLGWREMELVSGRLVVRTELIHTSMDLRAIQKIVGDDDHTFIYIASVNALIVPMKAYPDEDFDEFIAELRQAWEERIAAPPEDDAWRPAVDERIVRRS